MKQIGKAAQVNSALLYYYFGDKEQLYRAVFKRLVTGMVSRTLGRLGADAPPPDSNRGFIEAQVETILANPNLPELFVREMVDHETEHAVEQIQRLAATSFKGLATPIEEGQAEGRFRANMDPKFATISTVAQVAYFFIARPAVHILLGSPKRELPPEVITAFTRHAADFALAALATGSPVAPGSRKRRIS